MYYKSHGDLHVTKYTQCPYPHGDIHVTIHIHMEISMWLIIHSLSASTWRHGHTPCPYPQGDMEILHVHIHMETWRHMQTWRHSMSISTWCGDWFVTFSSLICPFIYPLTVCFVQDTVRSQHQCYMAPCKW